MNPESLPESLILERGRRLSHSPCPVDNTRNLSPFNPESLPELLVLPFKIKHLQILKQEKNKKNRFKRNLGGWKSVAQLKNQQPSSRCTPIKI